MKIWRLHIFMAKDNEKYHLHQDRKKKEKVKAPALTIKEPRHTPDELDRLIDPEPLYNLPQPKMEKNENEIDILRGK